MYISSGLWNEVRRSLSPRCPSTDRTRLAAHDAFKAGFDSILSHLDKPPLDDLPNFLGYCQSWAEAIAEHHDSEGMPRRLRCVSILLIVA